MKILLCMNGTPGNRPAIAFGKHLAALLQAEVVLLGIVEDQTERPRVEALIDEAGMQFDHEGLSYQCLLLEGLGEQVIPAQASRGEFLTVLGPLGRPSWLRWLRGRSIRRLLASIQTPLAYVRVSSDRLQRMLVCVGGIGYAAPLVQVSKQLALAAGAEVTLLHVVEPVTFEYPIAREAYENWQTLLTTATPQAHHLQAALHQMQAAGLQATVRIRQGFVTQEILSEMQQEAYDLIGLGSHYAAQGLRPLFTPNVTSEVAEVANCPVLIVRQ